MVVSGLNVWLANQTLTLRMQNIQREFNQCLYFSSSALHRWLTKLGDRHFRAVELTPTQGFILMVLKWAPGIIVSHLADTLQMEISTVTKALDKLSAKELVHKETFGRVVRVFATEPGLTKEADAVAAWKKFKNEYRGLAGAAKTRAVADSISEVLDQLRE